VNDVVHVELKARFKEICSIAGDEATAFDQESLMTYLKKVV
jgi:translation initiation factor 1 (eIF-1/SUI1)